MAKRKASTPAEPVVVRNIDELVKGIPKQGKLLVHLTQAQWTGISKGLKRGTAIPKQGIMFAFTPFPDGSGGIGSGECISGPCEICSERWRLNPDGSVFVMCRCRRDPACPPPPPERVGRCQLVFRRAPFWRIECDSVDCTGTCRLVGVPLPNGVTLITCACG